MVQYFTLIVLNILIDDDARRQSDMAMNLWSLWIRSSPILNGTEVISGDFLKFVSITLQAVDFGVIMLIRTLVNIMAFVAVLSVREIATKLWKILDQAGTKFSLQQLADLYLKMELQIGLVNCCVGPLILGWFVVESGDFMVRFFQIFSRDNPSTHKVINILCITQNVATLVLAAEAHSLVKFSKISLLQQNYKTDQYYSVN